MIKNLFVVLLKFLINCLDCLINYFDWLKILLIFNFDVRRLRVGKICD